MLSVGGFTRRAVSRGAAAVWFGFALMLSACDQSPVGVTGAEVYRVVEGACGDVHFVEALGRDLATALDAVEGRKARQFGAGQATLETFRLRVVDETGSEPRAEFHAVRVLDTDTGLLRHSVVEVVTTEGDLFRLEWCAD